MQTPSTGNNAPHKKAIIAVLDPNEPVVDEAFRLLSSEHDGPVVACNTIGEAAERIAEHGLAVAVFAVTRVEALVELVVFGKSVRHRLDGGSLCLIALNRLNQSEVPRILNKMGCSEVLSSVTLKASAVRARVIEQLAILDESRRILEPPPEISRSSEPRKPLSGSPKRVRFTEALASPGDCWLLRAPEDVRMVRDQWIIDLVGPGPSVGRWSRVDPPGAPKDPSKDVAAIWEWKPKEVNNPFVEVGASWVFYGKRPEFTDFHWVFIGKEPKLSYLLNGRAVVNYFEPGPERSLLVARNSETARRKWEVIRTSVLVEYKVKTPKFVTDTSVWSITQESKSLPIDIEAGPESSPAQLPHWRDLMGLDSRPPETKESKEPARGRVELLSQIQQNLGPKPELFSPIQSEATLKAYFRELGKEKWQVLGWTRGQKLRMSSWVEGFDPGKRELAIRTPDDMHGSALFTKVAATGTKQLFFNISLRRGSLFFVAKLEQIRTGPDQLIISLPQSLYEVQRRSHFRLSIPEKRAMTVRVDEEEFPVLNISSGGLGLSADCRHEARFAKGTVLERIRLVIDARPIECRGQIRWVRHETDTQGKTRLQMGLQFLDLPAAEQQKISLYVLEAGYEYLKENVTMV